MRDVLPACALMTQPLVGDVGPRHLALNRLADTALAAAVCLLTITLVRPWKVPTAAQSDYRHCSWFTTDVPVGTSRC